MGVWLLLGVTGVLLLAWALYYLLPFAPDAPAPPPTLFVDNAWVVMIAAPAFAAFLAAGLCPPLPSAPAVEVVALTQCGAAFAFQAGYLGRGLVNGAFLLDTGYGDGIRTLSYLALELLFLGLVAVAAAYIVSVRRARNRRSPWNVHPNGRSDS